MHIPKHFENVKYIAARIPGVKNSSDLSLGANCQLFAYELLRHFGKTLPPFRSSELWADKQYTLVVAQPDALDLMLYHSKPQAYGAHVGVYVGDGIIYHLS